MKLPTAALLAPIAVSPKTEAKSSRSLKFSPDFKPLPPETTILAAYRSGRSDLTIYSETNCILVSFNWASNFSTSLRSPLPEGTSSKLVVLKVKKFYSWADLTVTMAFPA